MIYKCIPIVFLFFSFEVTAKEFVGFLLSPEVSFVTFVNEEDKWLEFRGNISEFKNREFNIFFNGKTLGKTKIGANEKCYYKKIKKVNDSHAKLCDQLQGYLDLRMNPPPDLLESTSSISCPNSPPNGEFDFSEEAINDFGEEVSCDSKKQTQKKTFWPEKNIDANFVTKDIEKAQATKKMIFEWGGLGLYKKRPILLSTKNNIDDPQKWSKTSLEKIPEDIRNKIFEYFLSQEGNIKCIPVGNKVQFLKLSKKDINVVYIYKSEDSKKYVINLNLGPAQGKIETCSENAFLTTGLIVIDGKEITNIIHGSESNYIELELLEAADLNKDGISELYFAKYDYNYDGFAIYDFNTKTLTKIGRSSN